jgi:hypothetical protein
MGGKKMSTVLVGKPERKRPLGRPRWKNEIRMDLVNIDWRV